MYLCILIISTTSKHTVIDAPFGAPTNTHTHKDRHKSENTHAPILLVVFCRRTHDKVYLFTCIHIYVHICIHTVPSSSPANITVISTTATSITLGWDAPPGDTLNGHLIGYLFIHRCSLRVTCQRQICTELEESVPVVRDDRRTYYTFEGLVSFMNYSFEGAAETSAGYGPFSFSVTMETEEAGKSSLLLINHKHVYFMVDLEQPDSLTSNFNGESHHLLQ